MASLEFHYGSYRIVFRFSGQKFRRSLKTDNERSAKAALARVEDNLSRLEMGQLLLPIGAVRGRERERESFRGASYTGRANAVT